MKNLASNVSGVLVFPGQGSQFVGMGKSLYQSCNVARNIFDEAQAFMGFSVLNLNKKHFEDTAYVQQALLTLEYACFRSFSSLVPEFMPTIMAGHSLGEITALLCAEVLTFTDALKLVQQRGTIMQGTSKKGAMLALINVDATVVKKVCEAVVEVYPECYIGVSAYNSDHQLVLSGDEEAIDLAEKNLRNEGHEAIRLNNRLAFHSPLMQEAADKFAQVVENIDFNHPKCTVLSNVTAEPFESADAIKKLIVEQISAPVKWRQTMARILRTGLPVIELGPKNTLSRLANNGKSTGSFISTDNPITSFSDIEKVLKKDMQAERAIDRDNNVIIAFIEKTLASTRTSLSTKKEGYIAVKQCLEVVRGLDGTIGLNESDRDRIKKAFQRALNYKEITAEKRQEFLAMVDVKPKQDTISLLCFSYAGGSTQTYSKWQNLFDQSSSDCIVKVIPVEYPGRGSKSKLPLETDVAKLIESIYSEYKDVFQGRYALFGHSLGGSVAYQLSNYLVSRRVQLPIAVFVSGCPIPNEYKSNFFLTNVSDDVFLENLKSLNGIPDYVYESEELLTYYLPILKSDITLLRGWDANAIPDPGFPLIAYGGDSDSFADEHVITAWEDFHKGEFSKKIFVGDHFFINTPEEVIRSISSALSTYSVDKSQQVLQTKQLERAW